MGRYGYCCKCKKKGANRVRFVSVKTGKDIVYRCGWSGFCDECLPIAQRNHPEMLYIITETDVYPKN